MRNIKLVVEYDGSNYSGWQVQNRRNKKDKKTIQQCLEKALGQILQEKVKLIGSGRTDAGVHAQGQVANCKTKSKLSCGNIQLALNSLLADDIRIKQVREVPLDFHARFSAQSKLYRYSIVNGSFVSPFLRDYAYLVKYPLDVQKMRRAAKYLLGKHDFRSFQAKDKIQRHSLRKVLRLVIRKHKNLICLDIEADGFLYRMARNIVGTLIEVGRGRLRPEGLQRIIKAKNREYAGPCAPAKGLCLMAVRYSFP